MTLTKLLWEMSYVWFVTPSHKVRLCDHGNRHDWLRLIKTYGKVIFPSATYQISQLCEKRSNYLAWSWSSGSQTKQHCSLIMSHEVPVSQSFVYLSNITEINMFTIWYKYIFGFYSITHVQKCSNQEGNWEYQKPETCKNNLQWKKGAGLNSVCGVPHGSIIGPLLFILV